MSGTGSSRQGHHEPIVKKLVGLGWVFERKNPEDRRFSQLGMTEEGKAALYEWAANHYGKRPGTFTIRGVKVWEGERFPRKTDAYPSQHT